jgi:hypothetical protein
MTTTNYAYPIGDFLSGFSEDNQNPCEYELECQRMTIRGVQYLEREPAIFQQILKEKELTSSSPILKEMIDFMCSSEDSDSEDVFGQTGGMVGQTLRHAIAAKRLGWDSYIETITKKDENE